MKGVITLISKNRAAVLGLFRVASVLTHTGSIVQEKTVSRLSPNLLLLIDHEHMNITILN